MDWNASCFAVFAVTGPNSAVSFERMISSTVPVSDTPPQVERPAGPTSKRDDKSSESRGFADLLLLLNPVQPTPIHLPINVSGQPNQEELTQSELLGDSSGLASSGLANLKIEQTAASTTRLEEVPLFAQVADKLEEEVADGAIDVQSIDGPETAFPETTPKSGGYAPVKADLADVVSESTVEIQQPVELSEQLTSTERDAQQIEVPPKMEVVETPLPETRQVDAKTHLKSEQPLQQRAMQQVVEETMAHLSVYRGRGASSSLTVRLDPPELGEVLVKLERTSDGLQMRVTATETETQQFLQSHEQDLAGLMSDFQDDVSLDFGGESGFENFANETDNIVRGSGNKTAASSQQTVPQDSVTGHENHPHDFTA